jgi:hypothetical protein
MNFSDLMNQGKNLLVVSLPENTYEYARVAVENGADAVKLHINLRHRVTKQIHSSWDTLKPVVEKIKSNLNCAVGIVPGAETMASESEIMEMLEYGISFYDVYIDFAPLYLLKSKMCKMFALNYTYERYMAEQLSSFGADAVEISIVNPENYGKSLTLMDLIGYKDLIEKMNIPAFVPTQKKIKCDEVKKLIEIGFKGLIIGPIVTGSEIEEFGNIVNKYKKSINQ